MRSSSCSALVAVVLLLGAGCAPTLIEGRYACGDDEECPGDWVCRSDGRCWASRAAIDGGASDGGVDAGPIDAAPDGGTDAGCVPGERDVDLLVMIDKSRSMPEEQAAVALAFPELMRGLSTGDVDNDGTRDFPPITSLHVGVVTSDLGANGLMPATCSGRGDDAVLIDRSLTEDPSCDVIDPSYLPYGLGDSVTALATDFACISAVGLEGCGFEQQLEATLKALVPMGSSYVFFDGALGNGDDENAGFLREDSILVVFLITDEEDCSTHNTELFLYPGGAYEGIDPNARCYSVPEVLLPTARFVEGLSSTRPDPEDLIFAGLIGMPEDLHGESAATILADSRMAYTILPDGRTVQPACTSTTGSGLPGRRYVEVADGLSALGAGTLVHSICQTDFQPTITALLEELAPRLERRACTAP